MADDQKPAVKGDGLHVGDWVARVMPAFGKKLSQSEIDALAAYVRTFKTLD